MLKDFKEFIAKGNVIDLAVAVIIASAFGVIVARSSASAKARARQRWLQGQEQVHKDDLHRVEMDRALDDLLPIHGNGQWHHMIHIAMMIRIALLLRL